MRKSYLFKKLKEYINESKEDTLKLVNHVGQSLTDRFLKYKNLLKSPENDIYYWLKKDAVELEDRLNEFESTPTKTRQKELDKLEGAEFIKEENGYKVYHITSEKASCFYGKGTKWCISALNNNQFNHYTSKGVKFYFFIKGDEKYALALYPKIFEKKSGGLKTNFALYNSEDKLIIDYEEIKALNLPEIPGVELVYEQKSVEIKDNILVKIYNHNIENGAFIIPDNVTEIGDDAFYYCISLKSIEIPNSVTKIGDNAFYSCESLTSINIPNTVTEIGDYAFAYCKSLESINMPDSVIKIGDYAFYYCTSLKSINIPNNVTEIGDYAFSDCKNLKSIIIPNSVTQIGDYAFAYCISLKSIEIPNSVTKIGDDAFHSCESLTSINIPNSVTKIGVWAFYYCTSLTSIICEEDNETYRKLKEEYGEIVKLKSKNEALTEDKINLKSIHYWKNPETDEWNPTIIVDGKKARLRAGMMIIKDKTQILLGEEEQEPGVFSLPGGAIDKGETPVEAAVREAKEEVNVIVANAKETGYDYCVKHDDALPWVKENVPEEEWWYHYYTCLCIGEFDGYYDGDIYSIDEDPMLLGTSKFYDIEDVVDEPSFKPEWKKALIKFGYLKEDNIDEKMEIHTSLNSKIWDENNELLEDVEYKIYDIVDEFKKQVEETGVKLDVKDIYLLGSNANYNYTEDSDLDIHIMADESFDCNEKHLQIIYDAYKSLFNSKYDITINGLEVELYVENINNMTNVSTGIYSFNKGWIKEPSQYSIPKIDEADLEKHVLEWENRYLQIMKNPSIDKIDKYIDEIYKLRTSSIKKEGEFGLGNLTFKEIRKLKYLNNMKTIRLQLKSAELSLK